jgi:hypothetical protein
MALSFFGKNAKLFSTAKEFANIYDMETQLRILEIAKKNIAHLPKLPMYLFSLIASDNQERSKIMTLNKKYSTVKSFNAQSVYLQDELLNPQMVWVDFNYDSITFKIELSDQQHTIFEVDYTNIEKSERTGTLDDITHI